MFESTLPAMLQEAISRAGSKPALRSYRSGKWHNLNWDDFGKRLKNLGTGLIELKINPEDKIIILGPNSEEWALADTALMSIGAISVPIYPTLDLETVYSIIKDSQARGIILIGEAAAQKFREVQSAHELPKSSWLTIVAQVEHAEPGWHRFENIIQQGQARPEKREFYGRLEQVKREELATLIYTSGTTGEPKGVMLTHANLLSNLMVSLQLFKLKEGREVYLSMLPLSHSFERHCHFAFMAVHSEIVYSRGFDHLAEDLQTIEPTVFAAVPRVFEKIYSKLQAAMESRSSLSRHLFGWSVRKAQSVASGGSRFGFSVAESLVLNKIRRRFGSRLRFVVCGGGTLMPALAQFFNAIGVNLVEGYGLTEASPVISCNTPERIRFGTVGKLYSNLAANISKEGELLVKGPSVFPGYYRKSKETAAALDANGWLRTGDLASIDGEGYVTITGRLKEIIKTSGGKIIAPLKLEELLLSERWCDQACIIGDAKPYATALIVIDPVAWQSHKNLSELIWDESVHKRIAQEIAKLNNRLSPFETIKRFALLPHAFSEQNGTLTPTQKVRRHVINKQYAALIQMLYKDELSPFEGKIANESCRVPLLAAAEPPENLSSDSADNSASDAVANQ